MGKRTDETEPLHPYHTFLLQRNKGSVSSRRKKHFHLCTNLPPGERNNDFLHLPFHFDIRDPGRYHGLAVFPFPFHVFERYSCGCEEASRDFVVHKTCPAYHAQDGIPAY